MDRSEEHSIFVEPLRDGSIEAMRVAVVGVGALGSEVCRLLAQGHAAHVVLIDPDRLEARNLLYSEMLRTGWEQIKSDDGVEPYKVEVVARAGSILFEDAKWISCAMEVADVDMELLRDRDLIFSCTDTLLARCETSWMARRLGKQVIDGGVKGEAERQGRVGWFSPRVDAACYLCQIAEDRRADVLRYAITASLGCMEQPLQAQMDAPTSLIAMVAKQMVEAGMKAVLENWQRQRSKSRAWIYDMSTATIHSREIELQRSVTCPWHESEEGVLLKVVLAEQCVRSCLRAVSAREGRRMVLELDWPVCLRARCRVCGVEQSPMERVGLVRRRGVCVACGEVGQMDVLEMAETIGEDAAIAEKTFLQLGFKHPHLFCFRPEYF